MEKWGWWWEKRKRRADESPIDVLLCVYTCWCNPSPQGFIRACRCEGKREWAKKKQQEEEKRRKILSSLCFPGSCDGRMRQRLYEQKTQRGAGAAGVSQRRQRRGGGNAAQGRRPATPTHQQRRRSRQHHDTAPSYHYRYPVSFPIPAGCLIAWDGHNSRRKSHLFLWIYLMRLSKV